LTNFYSPLFISGPFSSQYKFFFTSRRIRITISTKRPRATPLPSPSYNVFREVATARMTGLPTDKDGTPISGAKRLRDAAWHTVAEGQGDGGQPVAIKSFQPPASARDDPLTATKVAKEQHRLLISAQLQKELSDSGATCWVRIRKISDHSESTYVIMDKCSRSVEGLIEHRVQPDSSLLYAVASGIVTGLEELWQRQQRSHENLKPSNILESSVAGKCRYRLSDPAPQGKKDTSANDLFALGNILFQLVEHKKFDAINGRIHGSANWDRLGTKKKRWIEFCEYLLNPAGCQDGLPEVAHRLARLHPSSRWTRRLAIAIPIVAAVISVAAFLAPRLIHHSPSAPSLIAQGTQPTLDNQQPTEKPSESPAAGIVPTPPSEVNSPTLVQSTHSDPLIAAKNALGKKDYITALSFFSQSAQDGNAEAMANLGWLYQNGLGIEKNRDIAKQWYRKAADLDNPDAMALIGRMYELEPGVAPDYSEAMKWYRKAVELGSAKTLSQNT